MKIFNFEFRETPGSYRLLLNNAHIRVWAKSKHSKQDAESRASDIVGRAIRNYGMTNVYYNGNSSVITLAENFFK